VEFLLLVKAVVVCLKVSGVESDAAAGGGLSPEIIETGYPEILPGCGGFNANFLTDSSSLLVIEEEEDLSDSDSDPDESRSSSLSER
jgi:hypothetical protein